MTELLANLTIDDGRTAQDAGARFARALVGASSAVFMVALAEQEDLIRRTITGAGHSAEQARLAAEHFEMAARDEWKRLASAPASDTWGTA